MIKVAAETFLDGKVTMLLGDVRAMLKTLPNDHFDCVVTSPPYWGLRDYGMIGQIGLEPTLGEHIAVMVNVFEEVRRVLKPTGTLWLNYGDCYATSPNKGSTGQEFHTGRIVSGGILKPKDLCMIPNRIAIALQEAGWWVRSEIIWHKPNPMPESIRDRPTTSHEKIWLMTKSERYFFDADAVRENVNESQIGRVRSDPVGGKSHQERGQHSPGGVYKLDKQRGHSRRHAGFNDRWDLMSKEEQQASGRNIRNVWTIATHPFSEAHFATFPPDLAERCIKAGSPVGGTVLDPFGGSGTTALVAATLDRTATLIELNPEYAIMARARIEAAFMGREEGSRHMIKNLGKLSVDAGPLFATTR